MNKIAFTFLLVLMPSFCFAYPFHGSRADALEFVLNVLKNKNTRAVLAGCKIASGFTATGAAFTMLIMLKDHKDEKPNDPTKKIVTAILGSFFVAGVISTAHGVAEFSG